MEVYGFGSEQEAAEWKGNPLDHAGRIARAGIPVLHVVGDADTVVPVAENTAVFEAEMKRLGAPVKVIHKPGIGHHPHSLNNPEPIVKFILQATGRYGNPCTQAVPGNEFRSAAGWKEGSEWHTVERDIEESLLCRWSLKMLPIYRKMLLNRKYWDQIEKDLTFWPCSISPESWDAANLGRATKGAAKALLGKAYMQQHKYDKAKEQLQWLIDKEGSFIRSYCKPRR